MTIAPLRLPERSATGDTNRKVRPSDLAVRPAITAFAPFGCVPGRTKAAAVRTLVLQGALDTQTAPSWGALISYAQVPSSMLPDGSLSR
jgi:hypothetical protein